jgi:hypothetical protein
LLKALLACLFSYNIQWGATKKEVEHTNTSVEVPRMIKRFRVALGISAVGLLFVTVLNSPFVPVSWHMDGAPVLPFAIACACHILFPVRGD